MGPNFDATRWKETWSHHNRGTTWDTPFARWFVDRKGCVEKLLDSLPEEVWASRLLQRTGMLVAHIKTEKKKAHVARTQLRNSDPLPDGAIETEGRGSLDLRENRKNIVDWVNGDSKDTGNRKDVTTNTQEHPHSLWRNGKAALSERVGNWMRHSCAGITTLERVAKRWLRFGVWITVHDRNERFPPCRYFVSLNVLSSILPEIRDARCCTNCWTRLLE